MSNADYVQSDDYYDFSGDEPAEAPDYTFSGEHWDFGDDALDPPTVIGLRDPDDDSEWGLPNPLELGRSLIGVPGRILRAFTGWGSGNEDDAPENDTASEIDSQDAEDDEGGST